MTEHISHHNEVGAQTKPQEGDMQRLLKEIKQSGSGAIFPRELEQEDPERWSRLHPIYQNWAREKGTLLIDITGHIGVLPRED